MDEWWLQKESDEVLLKEFGMHIDVGLVEDCKYLENVHSIGERTTKYEIYSLLIH